MCLHILQFVFSHRVLCHIRTNPAEKCDISIGFRVKVRVSRAVALLLYLLSKQVLAVNRIYIDTIAYVCCRKHHLQVGIHATLSYCVFSCDHDRNHVRFRVQLKRGLIVVVLVGRQTLECRLKVAVVECQNRVCGETHDENNGAHPSNQGCVAVASLVSQLHGHAKNILPSYPI